MHCTVFEQPWSLQTGIFRFRSLAYYHVVGSKKDTFTCSTVSAHPWSSQPFYRFAFSSLMVAGPVCVSEKAVGWSFAVWVPLRIFFIFRRNLFFIQKNYTFHKLFDKAFLCYTIHTGWVYSQTLCTVLRWCAPALGVLGVELPNKREWRSCLHITGMLPIQFSCCMLPSSLFVSLSLPKAKSSLAKADGDLASFQTSL